VGSEQTRPSPTSRGLGRFVSFRMRRQGGRRRQAREQEPAACEGGRWATLPCPAGARGAAGVRGRRCLPLRGKSASDLARRILGYRGGKLFAGRFALQE